MPKRRIPHQQLRTVLREVFEACSMPDDAARIVADVLVETDLRAVHSHGAALAGQYATALRAGSINAQARPTFVSDRGAAIVMDGDGAMGHLAASLAMQAAIDRARDLGIGAVAVTNTNHCGAAGHYARLAVNASMIGLVFTTAVPTMAPAGGRERTLGMNPIAIGVPALNEPPVVLDAAFAMAARGRVVLHAKSGQALPDGWALDAQGEPTTDPEEALDGLLQPIAGYKGSGLAVTVGLIASVLGGAAFGSDLGNLTDGPVPHRDGLLALAMDPAAFGDPEEIGARVDAATASLRQTKPTEGNDRVLLPGDRAAAAEEDYRQHGIPLPGPIVDALVTLCDELGVDTSPITS